MAAFSRGLRFCTPSKSVDYICSRCLQFSTSSAFQSGHSRWSKIKHDKGSADSKKNAMRAVFAHEISTASRLYGPDPTTNVRLASAIGNAKKAGFPKATLEAAIARGQGFSSSGAALESLTLEAIMPPSLAFVIDIETDKRVRALAELRHIFTKRGGVVSPTSYLFSRRGTVCFEKDEKLGVDEVLEEAIEAGAEDVELDEDGGLIVWTEPVATKKAEEKLKKKFGLQVKSSEIIWDPNEDTMALLDKKETAQTLMDLLDELHDYADVKAIFCNIAQGKVDDATWSELGEKLTG